MKQVLYVFVSAILVVCCIKEKHEQNEKTVTSMEDLPGIVQSIVAIPDYPDGSVYCTKGDDNIFRFEVRPSGLATKLAEAGPSAFSL